MALTTDSINHALDQLVNNYTGSRIGMPNGAYSGECTAVPTWYLQYLGLSWNLPMANNRADGWGIAPPTTLKPYFSFESYQNSRAYPRGTILMWNSPHVAVVLADAGGDNIVTVFEQNADPDGSPCHTATRIVNNQFHTCTYAMVPIIEAAPPASKYQVVETYPEGKQVKLNKQPTNLWGMNYDFDYMKDHPVEVHNQGEVVTVTNKVHHNDGYDYYRREGQVDGFNVLDCDDYTPPAPTPYTPPAAPVPIKQVTKYTVVTTLKLYATAFDALVATTPKGELEPGTYVVIGTDKDMLNLSDDNRYDRQQWINPKDNVVPEPVDYPHLPTNEQKTPPVTPATEVEVTPELAWYDKINWFNTDRMPVIFLATRELNITDLSGSRPEIYHATTADPIKVYGTITKGTTKYYLLKLPSDTSFHYRFAVPMVDDMTGKALLLKQQVKQVRNRDHFQLIKSELDELGLKFIDGIIPKWYRKNNKKKG